MLPILGKFRKIARSELFVEQTKTEFIFDRFLAKIRLIIDFIALRNRKWSQSG